MDNYMNVILEPVMSADMDDFKKSLQEAFMQAVEDEFGKPDEPIPSDDDFEKTVSAPGAEVYHIVLDKEKVGGVVLNIGRYTQHNSLDFLFVSPNVHSMGIGQAAWKAIEEMFPETVVWETVTPYFEKRNIHFYVNKCGFQIVEFWNSHNPDPHGPPAGEYPSDDYEEMFLFRKVMK